MNSWGILALAAAAGFNAWLTLLIVAGLATYTAHAPLEAGFTWLHALPCQAGLAVLLGLDVVGGKLRQVIWLLEPVNLVAAAGTGALLSAALPAPLHQRGVVFALVAAALAVVIRLGWRRGARALNPPLLGFGHIAASIVANLAAAVVTAATFAVLS